MREQDIALMHAVDNLFTYNAGNKQKQTSTLNSELTQNEAYGLSLHSMSHNEAYGKLQKSSNQPEANTLPHIYDTPNIANSSAEHEYAEINVVIFHSS